MRGKVEEAIILGCKNRSPRAPLAQTGSLRKAFTRYTEAESRGD